MKTVFSCFLSIKLMLQLNVFLGYMDYKKYNRIVIMKYNYKVHSILNTMRKPMINIPVFWSINIKNIVNTWWAAHQGTKFISCKYLNDSCCEFQLTSCLCQITVIKSRINSSSNNKNYQSLSINQVLILISYKSHQLLITCDLSKTMLQMSQMQSCT